MAKPYLLFFTFSITPFLCTTSLSVRDALGPKLLISKQWQPMQCNATSLTPSCNSYLYVVPGGRSPSHVASVFTANASLIQAITRRSGTVDFLVRVPCMCEPIDDSTTNAFLHDTIYTVEPGDTPISVTSRVFSGLAWHLGDATELKAGVNTTVHLPCGCSPTAPRGIVSYAVQEGDILSNIATLLNSNWQAIVDLNPNLTNPDFLVPGWILFVPMGVTAELPSSKKNGKNPIIIATSISAAFLVLCVLSMLLRLKRKSAQPNIEEPKRKLERIPSNKSIAALESHFFPSRNIEDVQPFQTERPIIFSLQAVEEATANFDEKRKIGEGGYGRVYLGIIGTQEIAIKKMRASKSKEFFAELKVLCKVHHINVVELIGYAAGEDHLYLVYEFVQNGSLSEHLHDPFLKGHQPLSWTARAQIALDAARGIEYIHDHTKACYVHRDIKTSNILLDHGLRAKVADFGLVKLVQRSEAEECLATRLVGTPGYLPPESVLELHMTTKSDVYAFGVVLAELITGLRALVRDNKEANKMKSLISIMRRVYEDADPQSSLEKIIDCNLTDNYPLEEVYKMANISMWCLSDDPLDRPEMREIMVTLSQIHMASIEWEASLGGNSEVFSGVFNGR